MKFIFAGFLLISATLVSANLVFAQISASEIDGGLNILTQIVDKLRQIVLLSRSVILNSVQLEKITQSFSFVHQKLAEFFEDVKNLSASAPVSAFKQCLVQANDGDIHGSYNLKASCIGYNVCTLSRVGLCQTGPCLSEEVIKDQFSGSVDLSLKFPPAVVVEENKIVCSNGRLETIKVFSHILQVGGAPISLPATVSCLGGGLAGTCTTLAECVGGLFVEPDDDGVCSAGKGCCVI